MLSRFFGYYRPYRTLFIVDFACAVLSGLLELGFPMAVKIFVDRLLLSQEWLLIVAASAALLLVYVVNTGLMAIVTYWGHMLGIIALMTFAGALLLMFSVNWQLALITALVVPLTAWVTSRYGSRMTHNFRRLFDRVGDFNTRIEENVGGMRVVQAFANENHERAQFEKDNQNYRRVKLEAYKIMAASTSLSYMSMRLTQMIVMIAGAYFVLAGELTAGGFIGFLLLVGVFFRPVEKINSVIETYPKGIAGFRRFTELVDTEPDIADAPDAVDVDHLKGEIVYDSVSFGYSEARPVLQNVSLTIHAGETIAFVGPSGAGKTTICSLLPRFYEIDEGAIRIDGIDIRHMKRVSLRQQIGIVQQDVFLFGGTIRDNIAYGRLGASEKDIVEAARRARLEDMLAALPQGLDTMIGERGVKLSGGQKQRVAIARMFLKNPPILILDEATSALDTETERAIQRSLAELAQGRTTLIIAHRLATIQGADRIVVIDANGIAEQGTHQDLVARAGAYNKLHSAQLGTA